MAAALLKSGAMMMVGPSTTTVTLSSPPCALSSKPSLQFRRSPIDTRQSSGNNASSSSGSWSTATTMTTTTTTMMTSSSRSSGSKGLRMRTRTAAGVRLAGSGSSAPAHVLTNADLSQLVETNDEWIAQRTGIRRRHVLAPGESLTQHAAASANRALEMAGVSAADVDMVLLSTSSPDDLFGSACAVASQIGASRAVAFDLTAACSGFVLGLVTGSQFIRTGAAKNVLVIGADALSRYVDWRDRGTCILFGDGCGAVLLTARAGGEGGGEGEGGSGGGGGGGASTSSSSGNNNSDGLLGSSMASDGAGQKHLNALFACDGGKALSADDAFASGRGAYANIAMNGQEVFKFAVRAIPAVLTEALRQARLEASDIDWLVLHQANQRILDAAATRLGVPHERVVSNLAEYGNTSAASIPLALDEAVRSGKIKAGDTLAIAGFGAGLTWAGAIVRWG